MAEIRYVVAAEMPVKDANGYFDGDGDYGPSDTLYVRNDFCAWKGRWMAWLAALINDAAKDFVKDHELRHLKDSTRPDIQDWITKEQRANIAGFRRHCIGAMVLLCLTVTSLGRWKYYSMRCKQGK